MQLIKQPSAYNFAGNIEPIKASTALTANFSLALAGSEILSETYDPINGLVTITLRDLLAKHAPEALISAGSVELPRYTFSLSNAQGVVSGSFVCLRGGHGASADAATFMRSNWLTWQPQSRTTSYHAPMRLVYASLADCSVWVKAYFADKSTAQVEHSKLSAGRLYTIDVTYGTIRGLFADQPTAYDVWIDGGGAKSYIQRYYLASEDIKSDVFMWRNSIGGVDTISFCGDRVERSSPESSSALFGDTECEFDLTARKSYLKYTGYIANNNERLWVLDFFNSTGRYHIDQGAMRSVVVSKPKLEHTRGELAGYEFEFAHGDQSIYLNLPRVDTPELLEIADPSAELFFLAPRLNQFQEAKIGQGDILIPCQFANADKWLFVSIAEILSNAQGSGSGGGAPIKATAPIGLRLEDGVYTITHHLATAGVDRHGTADKFGHVTVPPHIYGGDPEIDFAARSVRTNDISSHEALAAMIGYGHSLIVDPQTGEAHVWTDHVHARKSFETMEMRYRKMIVSGEELVISNGAVVSGVVAVGSEYLVTASGTAAEPIEAELIVTQDGEYISWPLPKGASRLSFTVKGEAGIDYQQFIPGDILRYTWRDKETGLKGASGYLTVRAVIDEFTYTADVVEGSPEWLAEGMSLALFGSETNPDRQGFIVLSARERTISIFDGVNSTQITPENLITLLGRLDGVVTREFGALKGSGVFCRSFYGYGDLVLKSTGTTVSHEISTLDGQIKANVSRIEAHNERINLAEADLTLKTTSITSLENRTLTAESTLSAAVSSIDSVTGEVTAAKAEIIVHASNISDLATGQSNLQTSIDLKADIVRIAGLLNVDGTIKTDSLVADGATITRLHAVSANIEGNITATSGRIVSLELGMDGTSYLNSEAMMFWSNETKAFIGRNTAPATLGYTVPAWFESSNSDQAHQAGGAANIGVYLHASGTGYTTSPLNSGNHAVFIQRGDIAGFAINTKKLYHPAYNNITLNPSVSVYVCYNNTADMTINLPSPSATQIGKVFYVKQMYYNVKLVGTLFRDEPKTEVWLQGHMTCMLINDGQYWIFNYFNS